MLLCLLFFFVFATMQYLPITFWEETTPITHRFPRKIPPFVRAPISLISRETCDYRASHAKSRIAHGLHP